MENCNCKVYTRKNRLVASDVFGNGLFFFLTFKIWRRCKPRPWRSRMGGAWRRWRNYRNKSIKKNAYFFFKDIPGHYESILKFLCRLQRAFTSGAIAIDCKGGHRFRVSIFLKVAVGWWCQWGRFIRNSLRTSLSDATPGKRLIELPGL